MKKWVVVGLFVAVVGMWAGVAYQLYSENRGLQQRVKRLSAENVSLRRDVPPEDSNGRGGAEEPSTIRDVQQGVEFAFPIAHEDYWITSPYGDRVSPLLNITMAHRGVDIASVWRAQVVAVRDGVVITHYPPPDGYFKGHEVYGGYIVVDHGDSVSKYAHLHTSYVREGQYVKKGQVIGRMGSTGQTTGMHLHFQLEIGEETVNPLLYIRHRGANNVE